MRSSFALLALAAGALARPQGVTSDIAPSATAPAGCLPTYSGTFEITVVNATSSKKRSLAERSASGVLTLSLADGVLTDQAGRTGYIASNYQFQFDEPPQAGAIYTSGFSVCGNDSLALGGSTIFYQCDSGDFFNLYDRSWAAQCSPIYLVALGGTPTTETSTGVPAVTQLSDGQPGATTAIVVSQISDGQIQQPTAVPVTQISDGQPQGPAGVPVTQISDGQPQAATGVPVSQISDGQPQVVSATSVASAVPVSQISDGQPQAATGVPVSQISDGQPQVVSATSVAATSAVAVVSQASDGQIVATSAPSTAPTTTYALYNGTVSTASPAQFTGGASSPIFGLGAVAAGVIGAVALI